MIDWTDAFDNTGYVKGSEKLAQTWGDAAMAYRADQSARGLAQLGVSYGEGPRQYLDLFLPEGDARGVALFIHGGYWHSMAPEFFSHLAEGARIRGWAVALPSYTIAPAARISEMTVEIGAAITAAAAKISGPIHISGHSAGGHLATRMACENAPLAADIAARIARVTSISGLHDLRPIILAKMNETLAMDMAEAEAESPSLLRPRAETKLSIWVGAAERPELMRQSRLLGEAWGNKTAELTETYEPGEDHFSVIANLANPQSALVREITR